MRIRIQNTANPNQYGLSNPCWDFLKRRLIRYWSFNVILTVKDIPGGTNIKYIFFLMEGPELENLNEGGVLTYDL